LSVLWLKHHILFLGKLEFLILEILGQAQDFGTHSQGVHTTAYTFPTTTQIRMDN